MKSFRWQFLPAIKSLTTAFLVCAGMLSTRSAAAQQVNVGGPFNTVGHGFYESIGTRWGARGPGWFFNFGGAPPPAFGGFDPNAGANVGGGFRAGNTSGFFNLNVGQGANSTMVSQTPSVTIPNGGNGYFIDGTFRPFVTSIIPVVGDQSDPSPLRERLRRLQEQQEASLTSPANAPAQAEVGGGGVARRSTAERGDLSVAEIKSAANAQGSSQDEELAAILEKARGAEEAGKAGVARIYYQMAARRATGEQQQKILAHLQTLPR
ncbi:hypothetical protein ETAA8_38570 [Anatilimnocola aggregata]|uniref:Uncharacterized protein n=1 Tax=Anatilimnocola aggregata TaxID=2528021 RepID=A0A517YF27_9BACT|nr:hypothetical protein [Anatilimnocola aggregata]QDU28752.1 hypothetical protein ETAA8_38570 [Anatilimnocola aggregata]